VIACACMSWGKFTCFLILTASPHWLGANDSVHRVSSLYAKWRETAKIACNEHMKVSDESNASASALDRLYMYLPLLQPREWKKISQACWSADPYWLGPGLQMMVGGSLRARLRSCLLGVCHLCLGFWMEAWLARRVFEQLWRLGPS